jgi:hypothetical protein
MRVPFQKITLSIHQQTPGKTPRDGIDAVMVADLYECEAASTIVQVKLK